MFDQRFHPNTINNSTQAISRAATAINNHFRLRGGGRRQSGEAGATSPFTAGGDSVRREAEDRARCFMGTFDFRFRILDFGFNGSPALIQNLKSKMVRPVPEA